MKKVKTKEAFKTKAHRVISKGAGEIINMPDEDYEEVRDKVTIIKPEPKKNFKTIKGLQEE